MWNKHRDLPFRCFLWLFGSEQKARGMVSVARTRGKLKQHPHCPRLSEVSPGSVTSLVLLPPKLSLLLPFGGSGGGVCFVLETGSVAHDYLAFVASLLPQPSEC